MSLEPKEGEESKAATPQVKRKTPSSNLRDQVAKFAKAMDSVLDEILELFEQYGIPDDWASFEPCDDEGYMLWMWVRPKNRYWLRVTVSTNKATADADKGEALEEVSLAKAVRRLRRMMDDDEEEDSEEDDD
jgi:hypothetical protein